MIGNLDLGDIRLIVLGGLAVVAILVIWAILSSFVSIVSGPVVAADKKVYNEMMEKFKIRFKDILENDSYTEVKRSYLMSALAEELDKINRQTSKKYLGAVVRERVKLHDIETFPGEIPNNVYLKMPTSDGSFIWVVFSDTKNRYIDFNKGEEVEIDGVIDQVNLVPANLPRTLDDQLDKFFRADFALHLQDDAKMRKVRH